jgi:NAD(P)-dependent dehydrogenase (short-subunit alcohol dehydrogenase family)
VDERSVEALFDAVETQLGPVAVLACVAGGPFLTKDLRHFFSLSAGCVAIPHPPPARFSR